MSANRDALFHAVHHWNAGDLDSYLQLYDESITLHGYSEKPMNKTEVRGFYEGLWSGLSDLKLEIDQVVEEDNTIAARCTMTARHTGELSGVPATGREITQNVMTILRFRDGKVVERWSVADMLSVLVQIGAISG